jgi:hypothetical protein
MFGTNNELGGGGGGGGGVGNGFGNDILSEIEYKSNWCDSISYAIVSLLSSFVFGSTNKTFASGGYIFIL